MQEREIRKDLELGVIPSTNHPPRFEELELVYFRARQELGFALPPDDRRKPFELVRESLATGRRRIQLGEHWVLDLGALDDAMRERLARFEAWKRERVREDPEVLGGEPVFVGTRFSYPRIGRPRARSAP